MTHHTHSCSDRPARRSGFTLVELLVVIGIIALLIGILLPALSGARRAAMQTKCAAALQEVGLGFQLYANEQKGYWPVVKLDPSLLTPPAPNGIYWIEDQAYTGANTGNHPAYWFTFIAPYVNAGQISTSAQKTTTGLTGQLAKRTVLWGCPAWDAYVSGSVLDVYTGYGMSDCPAFDPDQPTVTPSTSNGNDYNYIWTGFAGRFHKVTDWTHPGDRLLVADSVFWEVESEPAQSGNLPAAVAMKGQVATGLVNTWTDVDQTFVDLYRHGKKPGLNPQVTTNYDPNGGKIGYNVLFCDGHVQECSEAVTAYKSYRMRFPG